MFNKIYNSTLLCKLLALILIIISTIITNNIYILVFIILFAVYYSIHEMRYPLFFVLIINILLISKANDYISMISIVKFITIVCYIRIFYLLISSRERRRMVERFYYPFHNNSKGLIKKLYYNKLYKNNLNKLPTKNYYIMEETKKKTLYDLNDVYYLSLFLYYKYKDSRTYTNKKSWGTIDNSIIFYTVMLLILSIVLRWI